jgi:tetratricopeptide (TPR) repeat protein
MPSAPQGERKKLLLKRADVLSLSGDFEAAIAAFQEAAFLVSKESEPRMFFGLQFNLADNLLQAGRPEEAEALLPELRELTAWLGNDLDGLRLRWLEGRLAAGLGRTEEALTALAWVKEELTTRMIASDAALVTLEIAVLYLAAGRTSEVRRLARRLVWVFEDQGINREALAALRLFCEAAERERVSLDLARRIATFLRRAQGDPGLRFEDGRKPPFSGAAEKRGPES